MAAITNERQYRISKAQLRRLEAALEQNLKANPQGIAPRLHRAMLDGLRSQIEELREEIQEYERLKSRRVRSLELESLEELPLVLTKARIARGLTQAELAKALGIKPQQIQRYEATGYQSASFRRIVEIADVLGVQIRERVRLQSRKAVRASRSSKRS